MRSIGIAFFAVALALASAGALANQPVATLPSGAIVDLNTGIVTTLTGMHYKLSRGKLKALRERLTRRRTTTLPRPSATGMTGTGNNPERKQKGQPPQ